MTASLFGSLLGFCISCTQLQSACLSLLQICTLGLYFLIIPAILPGTVACAALLGLPLPRCNEIECLLRAVVRSRNAVHSLVHSFHNLLASTEKKDVIAEAASRLAGPSSGDDEVIHRKGQYSQGYAAQPTGLCMLCALCLHTAAVVRPGQPVLSRRFATPGLQLPAASCCVHAVPTGHVTSSSINKQCCLQLAHPVSAFDPASSLDNIAQPFRECNAITGRLLPRHVCRCVGQK